MTYLDRNVYTDVGSNDFSTTASRNLTVLLNPLNLSATFCQTNNHSLHRLQQLELLAVTGLNDHSDLVFESLAVGGEIVKTNNRTSRLDTVNNEVKASSFCGELLFWNFLGERSQHDGFTRVTFPPRQTLPQIFSHIRHEGVQQLETSFQTCVESVLGGELSSGIRVGLEDGLGSLNIDVTEVVEEVLVGDGRGFREVPVFKGVRNSGTGEVELVEEPFFDETFLASGLLIVSVYFTEND